jgi:two-component system, NtrC family, response regulator GlrR
VTEPRETQTIAVVGTHESSVDDLARSLTEAGRWGISPVHWPDPVAWQAASSAANAYVIHSDGACEELVASVRARGPRVPLIVVGAEPIPIAAPDLWLPTTPTSLLLGSLIAHLLDAQIEMTPAAAPSWRRKSDMIMGTSPQAQQMMHTLDQLAPSQTSVLVTGESGVGKELVARALHFCGPRAKHPFIALNCAAIPETLFEAELFGYQRGAFTGAVNAHVGAFEAAHNGTLFLDEIGELPPNMQAKLLRVLETNEVQRLGSTELKKVNFRLVSATNRDLADDVKTGRFREDLYYRIMVYPLHIPPLRERPEDIPPIVMHHLSAIGRRDSRPALRLSPAALERLIAYSWPGNVRELVNLLERAVLLASNRVIDAEHILFSRISGTEEVAAPVAYRDAKAKFEVDYYTQLMRTAGGNISLAAKLGQKTRKEIYDALRRFELDATDYRTPEAPDETAPRKTTSALRKP